MTTAENGRLFRSPFTANQWQEFEHQTLIFKYMISGVPVPPELLFPVKRSLESRLFPHHHQQPPPSIGWGCFQMGFGRKPDPEPGRCRRTDGKKWRCSKEAYPDSKYCEKHMHRGRNRSRKPVELSINSNSITTTNNKISSYISSTSLPSSSLELQEIVPNNPNPLIYSSHAQNDYRYIDGLKEGMNERDFFTNSSVNTYKSYPQQHQPQYNMSCSTSTSSTNHAPKQQQHYYILGADSKSTPEAKSMKLEKDSDHSEKPLHHFFNDCWLDLSSSSRSNTDG